MNNQRFRQKRKQTRAKKLSPCSPPIINHYLPPHAYSNNIRQAVILAAIAPPHRSAAVEQISEGVGLHLGFGLGCGDGSVTWSGRLIIGCYCSPAIAVAVGVCSIADDPPESSYIIILSTSGCTYHISSGIAISSRGIKHTCQTASVNCKTAAGDNISGSKTIVNICSISQSAR